MSGRHYAIHIVRSKDKTPDDVKAVMNKAADWYRVNEQFWIVYSANNAQVWYKRLKTVVGEDGELFIAAMDDTDRQGWIAKSLWTWLNKERP